MFRKIVSTIAVALSLVPGQIAHASGVEFDYKDPKEISSVSLAMESKLEPIFGYAKGISGKVKFDPANPKATTGKIAVDVSSVLFANEGYTQTARNYALQQDKYPQIFFTLKKVIGGTKPSHNVYKGTVLADFTCHGVTIPMTVPVTASYFPGLAEERTNGKYKGDILVIRTNFSVSRTKLGISAGIPIDLVGDTIEVRVSCVGIHYAPGQKLPGDEEKKPEPKEAKKDTEKSAANVKSSPSLWKMEVENRDNPVKVDATFDLNAKSPKASFKVAEGSLEADKVSIAENKMSFHIPDNPVIGEAEGVAVFDGEKMVGSLKTKEETIRIHARVKLPTDDVAHPAVDPAVSAPENGFQDLKIVQDGTTWSLAEKMKYHRVPAVSLARIENFKVVETGTFGVTNVETGELADSNTLFQAGGMGSPLVNILAIKLAGMGKLDLDRDANAYLKSAKIPDNEFTKTRKVKVVDLINGTSGLVQYKFGGYRPSVKIPTLKELLNGADSMEMEPLIVKSEPGTQFQGGGVQQAILQQIIEDATGSDLPKLMRELIFEPMKMEHSVYETIPVASGGRKAALGHYSTGELMLDKVHVYPATGESGLWTTAGDFALLMCQFQALIAGKPNLILEEDKRDLMKKVVNQKSILGLIVGDNDEFYHGGDSYGYFANHRTNSKNGSGIVVMENRIFSWMFNNEIIEGIKKRNPVTPSNR